MKFLVLFFIILSGNVFAQELLPPLINDTEIEETVQQISVTENQQPVAPKTSVEPSAQGESVFNNMLDTLFGSSSLPEPQGDLKAETAGTVAMLPDTSLVEQAPIPNNLAPAPSPAMNENPLDLSAPAYNSFNDPSMIMGQIEPIFAPPAPRQPLVVNFDIAGIKLRMQPKEVFNEAIGHGYKLEYIDKTFANFIKWRLERECMDAGVYIYEQKQKCIQENAKKTGDYYINYMEFTKSNSREKIRAFFTSSFSGNKLYRVTYYNEGDNSLGDTTASIYIKDKRKNEFFNWVTKKYGQPNNPGAMIWGNGGDAPYFEAFTSGSSVNFNLNLEDPLMPFEDSQAMGKADVKNVSYSKFSF